MPDNDPWTDAEIALLGTRTDVDLAKDFGRTREAVKRKRTDLQIPAFSPRHVPMTSEQISMLGKRPDGEIAKQVGCSRYHVFLLRKRMGILPFNPDRENQ